MAWEFDFLYLLQQMHCPFLNGIMIFLSAIGEAGLVWIAVSIVCVCVPKWRRCGLTIMISMALTYLVGNLILKNIFARPRPCAIDESIELLVKYPSEFSFPSGHTMNGFTAAVTIFLYQRKAGIAALVLAACIAFSRMYLFVHFPTDILGGILVGTLDALFVYYVIFFINKKQWRK